jgi:hypothetical protein
MFRTPERSCRRRSRRGSRRRALVAGHRLACREAVRLRARNGATLVVATHSRYVVDLNRDPSGAALYPGADNTELCPTRTFADEPIYARRAPDAAEVAARRDEYFEPYHALLPRRSSACASRHGYAILLDGHSIRSRVPRFFAGRLPDLNLGTADGASCAPNVQSCAALVLAGAADFSSVVNGRFKGGYVTRHYGRRRAASTRSSSRRRRPATWTRRRRIRGSPHARRARSAAAAARRGARRGPSRAIAMQRIFIASHRVEAYLLVDRLAHAGIKAHVFNEHTSSIVGEVPPDVAQPQVWLDDDADRRSRGRDPAHLPGGAQSRRQPPCDKCGEENPATFDLCWKCGWSLQPP